jgi:hypothetical protein
LPNALRKNVFRLSVSVPTTLQGAADEVIE